MYHRTHLIILFLIFVFSLAVSSPIFAESLTVESGDDGTLLTLAGNGTCDLREAIEAANTDTAVGQCLAGDAGADTIDLNGNSVTLSATLIITDDLTIQNGTVDGNFTYQVFQVANGAGSVTFDTVSIESGSSTVNGGGIEVGTGNNLTIRNSSLYGNTAANFGGAIYSESSLIITTDSYIENNSASSGGGVYVVGSVSLTDSTVTGNDAVGSAPSGDGGGIFAYDAVTVTNSEISDNTARNAGAGIRNSGAVTVTDSYVGANETDLTGGGIYTDGTVTVTTSEISDNTAGGFGGGIYAFGLITVEDGSIIAGNTSGVGGGGISARSSAQITDSVFFENHASFNGGAVRISAGGSLTTTGSIMIQNSTNGVGGAIYSEASGIGISSSLFDSNHANSNGGGLYISGSTVTVTDTIFSYNNANGTGGGVYINNGAVSVTGSCIVANSDTAVRNVTGTTATFTGNWWGASDGPFVVGQSPTGSGDSVEGNVDVSGFQTEPLSIDGFPCEEIETVPLMTFTKDDGVTLVSRGDTLTYTLSFANIATGEEAGPASNIFIYDYLPSNTTFSGCAITPPLTGSCGESGGVVTFTIDQMISPAESGSVTVSVSVNPDAMGTVLNEAEIYYEDYCGCSYFEEASDEDTIAEPTIEVFQDGFTPIPNNTGTATFVGTAGTPITSSIEIRNTGAADLTLTEPITLTGTGFTLLGSFGGTTVTPGNNTSFDVQCDAAAGGTYTGSISFGTNDPNASTFTFALDCAVDAPSIEVFQDGFTPIPNNTGTATFVGTAGTPITSSIEIRNTGAADLTLTEPITLTGTGFTLLSSFGSTTVTPGNNTSFDVQCDATADGTYTGSISFGTNDPNANPFVFVLDCQVTSIVVLPTSLLDGTVGTAYTQTITATGGSGSYTFVVTSGTLPTGLTLATDGTLSGTPTEAGTFGFTITATDSVTSFYGYRAYTVTIDGLVPTLPPPPPTPLCEDHNFAEGGVVRASTRDGLDYGINCRVLYQNGQPTQWLGGDLYNAGAIGSEGIFDLGVIQAIDIFSPVGWTYFDGGAVFCLRGSGTLIWMAAKNTPRVAEIIGSYRVEDFPGFTCATLFEPGTLVLVRENPLG